ncbi:MAG: hypothetical protein P9M01_00920 [Candidatus Kappaea frigidicola]|nr:hypothetical protein [Candidatus Kappaea frigidicola]
MEKEMMIILLLILFFIGGNLGVSIYFAIGCKQREKIMRMIEELRKEIKS